MTFLEAQQEFQIRFYLWGLSEWEKEISESFPRLQAFKAGTAWEAYQFLRRLDPKEQMTFARSLVKRGLRGVPDAVRVLGESSSLEEESLLSVWSDFFRIRGLYRLVKRFEENGQ